MYNASINLKYGIIYMYLQNSITKLQDAFKAQPAKLEKFNSTLKAAEKYLADTSFFLTKELNPFVLATTGMGGATYSPPYYDMEVFAKGISSKDFKAIKDAVAEMKTKKNDAHADRTKKFDAENKIPSTLQDIKASITRAYSRIEESNKASKDCLDAMNKGVEGSQKVAAVLQKQLEQCKQSYTDSMNNVTGALDELINDAGATLNNAPRVQVKDVDQAAANIKVAQETAFLNCETSKIAAETKYNAAIKQHVESCEQVNNQLVRDIQNLTAVRDEINNKIAEAAVTYILGKYEASQVLNYYMGASVGFVALEAFNKKIAAKQLQKKDEIENSEDQAVITLQLYLKIREMKQNIDQAEVTGSDDIDPELEQVEYYLPYEKYKDALVNNATKAFLQMKNEVSREVHRGDLGMYADLITEKLKAELYEFCPSFVNKVTGGIISNLLPAKTVQYPSEADLYCSFMGQLHASVIAHTEL